MSQKKKNSTRESRTFINLIYLFGGPILVIFIVFFLFGMIKGKVNDINSSPSSKTEAIPMNENQGVIDINSIINKSIDSVIEEENINININTEKEEMISATDSTISQKYENLTLSEILNGKNENKKEEKKSFIEKDLAIKYSTGKYLGITKDAAIVLEINKETKYIYLTGLTDVNSENLYYFLEGTDELYVEYDIQKKRGEGEQAYIWLQPPDNNHKENMLNVIVLTNKWGKYIDSSPNIKYTYYFLDIKE